MKTDERQVGGLADGWPLCLLTGIYQSWASSLPQRLGVRNPSFLTVTCKGTALRALRETLLGSRRYVYILEGWRKDQQWSVVKINAWWKGRSQGFLGYWLEETVNSSVCLGLFQTGPEGLGGPGWGLRLLGAHWSSVRSPSAGFGPSSSC